jgi:ORF6N domain.
MQNGNSGSRGESGTMTNIIDVENKMITLRKQQVILDSDVAKLYGVQTKEINQAVKNNPRKFPEGYIFQQTQDSATII